MVSVRTFQMGHYRTAKDSTPVDARWPQRKSTTKEQLENKSGEDVDSRIQVQLEEDGGGSTEQS